MDAITETEYAEAAVKKEAKKKPRRKRAVQPKIVLPEKFSEVKADFETIERYLCDAYGVTHDELVEDIRDRVVTSCRSLVIYLARKMARVPVSVLAKEFNRADANICRIIRVTEAELEANDDLRAEVDRMIGEIAELASSKN